MLGLSVFISIRYFNGPWVVGPVFAAAFLAANFDWLQKESRAKYLVFLLASTFIYALVHWLGDRGQYFKNDILDSLFGTLSIGVVFGSLTMSFLFRYLFSAPLNVMRRGCLWLIASWYLAVFIAIILDVLHIQNSVNFIAIAILFWQGIYFAIFKSAGR